jgi:molecular chaperone IbpA
MIYDNDGFSKNTQIYKYPDWDHKKSVSKAPSLNPFDLLSPFLSSWTVGFDRQFDALRELKSASQPTYPPYNIIDHKDDSYTIEVAIAGFSKEDIDIELQENKLTISGNKGSKSDVYLHKGIASREFSQTFLLADDVKIVSAELLDGILSISLEREVPDHKKPRKISIE